MECYDSDRRCEARVVCHDGAGDLALLVDTNHPMIHPEFERGLEWAKKELQANGSFCLQVSITLLIHTLCVKMTLSTTFSKSQD